MAGCSRPRRDTTGREVWLLGKDPDFANGSSKARKIVERTQVSSFGRNPVPVSPPNAMFFFLAEVPPRGIATR